ncbi:MAG: hypothetical protein HYZ17_05715 [Betaproteobacteria bacterium]|nr:hypothetical protein [Betaproteobacteria bacterium]
MLASCYELDRKELASVLENPLRTRELRIDRAEITWAALRLFRAGKADFADCLIHCPGREAACEATVTFDQAAAKACGMRVLG